MADLQGPKIRVERFENGWVDLAPGDPFILDTINADQRGNLVWVGVSYPGLASDV